MHNEGFVGTLKTARLVLTPVTPADVDALHAMWTDADVRRYLWDDVVIDRATAAAVVEQSARDWRERGYGLWLIADAATGDVAGFVGFRSSGDTPEPELLYGLLPRYWGRGLATEAAQAALQYAFGTLGLPCVHAATNPPNAASVQVLERLGMTLVRRGELDGLETLFYRIDRR